MEQEKLSLEQVNKKIDEYQSIIYQLSHKCFMGDRDALELSNKAEMELYRLKAYKREHYSGQFKKVVSRLQSQGLIPPDNNK